MGRKIFLVSVWMEGGDGKNLVGLGCFLSGPTNLIIK